jgi:hypothetical protein
MRAEWRDVVASLQRVTAFRKSGYNSLEETGSTVLTSGTGGGHLAMEYVTSRWGE